MSHPSAESLLTHALGPGDPAVDRHVAGCATCEADMGRLREAATMLQGQGALERRVETPECLDEAVVADFVEGRLDADARTPVVAHLLTCARCRSIIVATGRLLADTAVARETGRGSGRRWGRWMLAGTAAAAVILLVVWPRSTDHRAGAPTLREPASPDTLAPVPIAPRAAVARVDRFVWSSVPRVDRYRLRLYDAEGAVLWMAETADTIATRPDSVAVRPGVIYFWKVEAQTEWQRWVASDLVRFQVVGPGR
ncbi:MAG: hypothetical protein ACRDFT_08150 [bacterium]